MGYIWKNKGYILQKLRGIFGKNYGIYWPKTIGDISRYIWQKSRDIFGKIWDILGKNYDI